MKLVKGFYLLLSLGLVVSFMYARRQASTGELITVLTIDPILSHQEQQAITAWLEPYVMQEPAHALDELKRQFLSIDSVSVAYLADDRREVVIKGLTPLARLNNDTVLCTQGQIVPADIFQPDRLQALHQIFMQQVPAAGTVQEPLLAFVQRMKQHLFDRFSLYWHRESEVWFSDKQEPQFTIVATSEGLPSDAQIENCSVVYEQMKKESKKSTQMLRVLTDVRFNKQIIAYHKNEGG